MYPGLQAKIRPQQLAFIMATSGESATYAQLERRSNQLTHFLRASGLARLDHYAIFMENNARYIECCSAGERAGLYYTCVNSYLTPDDPAYILDNSESEDPDHLVGQARDRIAGDRAVPADRTLSCRRRPGRRRQSGQPRRGGGAISRHADRRRMPRHRHALFFRHDRQSQGHLAAAAGKSARAEPADRRFRRGCLALPRRHDLSLAGTALSRRTMARHRLDDPNGRHGK
jgi:AMP-binding enzyme